MNMNSSQYHPPVSNIKNVSKCIPFLSNLPIDFLPHSSFLQKGLFRALHEKGSKESL